MPAPQVARCDADVIQVDESSLSGNPEEWEWTTAVHTVLDAVPGAPAVPLCFGNYGVQDQDRP